MQPKITKGTMVRVITTNGGLMIGPLLENYYSTYDVVIDFNGHATIVTAWRLKSIEITPPTEEP